MERLLTQVFNFLLLFEGLVPHPYRRILRTHAKGMSLPANPPHTPPLFTNHSSLFTLHSSLKSTLVLISFLVPTSLVPFYNSLFLLIFVVYIALLPFRGGSDAVMYYPEILCFSKNTMLFYNTMNRTMMFKWSVVAVLTAVVALMSCDRRGPVWDRMDVAEKIMNEQPDSALNILNDIPASDIKGKETAARYALLKSMALDKNYIDTTSFDVLQPAIDYYLKKGNADEKLRTYYYQGRIYYNRHNSDSAMQCFIRGREYFAQATDTLTMGNLLVAQGTIFPKSISMKIFLKSILRH